MLFIFILAVFVSPPRRRAACVRLTRAEARELDAVAIDAACTERPC